MRKVHVPADEEVFVASVRVSGGVGVVLKQVGNAIVSVGFECLVCLAQEVLHDDRSGTVLRNQVIEAVAFGGGVFGV